MSGLRLTTDEVLDLVVTLWRSVASMLRGKPIEHEVPHLPDVTRCVASAQAPPPSQGSKAKAKRAYTQSAAHDETEG